MKELPIEEKAQRYDEAIERARQIHDSDRVSGIELITCEEIFPELKESEDEKIRKELHIYLDWLNGRKDYAPRGKYTIRDMIAWLEKQGEQKPLFKKGDTVIWDGEEFDILDVTKDSYNVGGYIIPIYRQNELLLKQKPVCKVEPKFHKGDWIVRHGTENIYQVVAVIDNQYQLKYGDTYTVQKCTDVDRCARLWDIEKDAKEAPEKLYILYHGDNLDRRIFNAFTEKESNTDIEYIRKDTFVEKALKFLDEYFFFNNRSYNIESEVFDSKKEMLVDFKKYIK